MKRKFTFISQVASLLIAAATFSLSTSVYGQEGGQDGKMGGVADNPHLRPSTPSAAATAAAKLSQKDQKFLSQIAAGGVQAVKDSEVAEHQGGAAVKNVAARIVNERGRSNKEVLDLAKKKGFGLGVDKIHARSMGKSNFDKQYVYSLSHDLQEDVNMLQSAASSADDKDVKAWAGKTLPMVRQHLSAVKGVKS